MVRACAPYRRWTSPAQECQDLLAAVVARQRAAAGWDLGEEGWHQEEAGWSLTERMTGRFEAMGFPVAKDWAGDWARTRARDRVCLSTTCEPRRPKSHTCR